MVAKKKTSDRMAEWKKQKVFPVHKLNSVCLHFAQVMTFGKKKHAIAVVVCHKGKGLIKCNGVPINLIHPSALRIKVMVCVLNAPVHAPSVIRSLF